MNKEARSYYDKFSRVYDWLSPKVYYHKARQEAVDRLDLKEGQTVLNVPIGTGQNLEYFQRYLHGTGKIIGVDISEGMLTKAFDKVREYDYSNVALQNADVSMLNQAWLEQYKVDNLDAPVDAIICDLGLSGFDDWRGVVDDLLDVLKPEGKLVVMDWELPEPSLRGAFIKWIGGGEVDRPIPAYLQTKLDGFELDHSFNRGGVFVASGIKPKGMGS
jgi:ubiquinone/menaquinone biosynthesis C-methylase UbiE